MSDSLVTGFGVHLKVRDIAASRAFYEDYLGLVPAFAYGDPAFLESIPSGVTTAPEAYHGVTYEIPGGSKIEIADGHIAVPDSGVFTSPIETPKVSAMLNVSSIASLLEASDIRSASSVKSYYWGTLEMVVRDPDGWVVVLIAPHSPAEESAIRKHMPIDVVQPNG